MINHLTFESLVTDIEDNVLNYANVLDHLRNGTMQQLYDDTISAFIEQAMMMPHRRGEKSLDISEEQVKTVQATSDVAYMLAAMCDRSIPEVEADLVEHLKKFPTDDLATATGLRRNNRLN